jgi:hypothetical protein
LGLSFQIRWKTTFYSTFMAFGLRFL